MNILNLCESGRARNTKATKKLWQPWIWRDFFCCKVKISINEFKLTKNRCYLLIRSRFNRILEGILNMSDEHLLKTNIQIGRKSSICLFLFKNKSGSSSVVGYVLVFVSHLNEIRIAKTHFKLPFQKISGFCVVLQETTFNQSTFWPLLDLTITMILLCSRFFPVRITFFTQLIYKPMQYAPMS